MSLNSTKLALIFVVFLLFSECYCLNKDVPKIDSSETEILKKNCCNDEDIRQSERRHQNHIISNNSALNNTSIEAQKEIDEMKLRFVKRDQINKNYAKQEVRMIQMHGCRDFNATHVTYILCVGVYDITSMIFFKDKDFWRATKSISYDLPSHTPISEEQYVDELNRLEELKNNNLITDQQYEEILKALQRLKQSEHMNTDLDDEHSEDENGFEKFVDQVMHETDHLIQDEYFKMSRFKQLEFCVSILATDLKFNDLITRIPRDDIIYRLIIKFAKMIDNRLKLRLPHSYRRMITDVEEIVKKIKKVQKKMMTGNIMINDNLRPVTKQVLSNSVFSIRVEEFFSGSPIDLEFYDFKGYKSDSSQGENIIMHADTDTLFGYIPDDLKTVEFDIAIVYYNFYDYNEYTVYFTSTKLTLNVTDNLDVEEPPSFVWKLFIIILGLCMTSFIAWFLFKIYKKMSTHRRLRERSTRPVQNNINISYSSHNPAPINYEPISSISIEEAPTSNSTTNTAPRYRVNQHNDP